MRTKDVRTGTLFGGMRGDRSSELQLIAPTPTLASVVLVNLTRLVGRLVMAAAKHPLALAAVVVLASLMVLVGWVGPLAVGLAVLVVLPAWRRLGPGSYRRVVTSRWRQVWTYARWWQPAMVTCGLAQEMNGREYLPKIRKVVAAACVDRVLVDLLSGQSPEALRATHDRSSRTPSRCNGSGSWSPARGGSGWSSPTATASPTSSPPPTSSARGPTRRRAGSDGSAGRAV